MEKFNFFTIFLLVFLAEIPCIVRTMALQVQNKGIWEVVLGTIAGSGLALVVGIFLAKFATKFIENPLWIQYCSGLAIIGLGILILLRSNS
jgi:putative Ca2+/H+ antiporter (TMEM165/GDT1 family)